MGRFLQFRAADMSGHGTRELRYSVLPFGIRGCPQSGMLKEGAFSLLKRRRGSLSAVRMSHEHANSC